MARKKRSPLVFGILLVVVAAIVGIELASLLVASPPPSEPVTISCTAAGITCASLEIDSANLTASSSGNGTLSIRLTNNSTGTDTNSSEITFYIESEELAQTAGILDNQTETYVLSVSPFFGVVAGESYSVSAVTVIGGETLTRNVTVSAK